MAEFHQDNSKRYMDLVVIIPSEVGQEKKKKTNTIIAKIIKLMSMNQVNKQKRLTKLENKFRVTQKGGNGEK